MHKLNVQTKTMDPQNYFSFVPKCKWVLQNLKNATCTTSLPSEGSQAKLNIDEQ